MIVSGVTRTPADVALYANCTLLATSLATESKDEASSPDNVIEICIKFLMDNEFIILQNDEEQGNNNIAYPISNTVLWIPLSPFDFVDIFILNFVFDDLYFSCCL